MMGKIAEVIFGRTSQQYVVRGKQAVKAFVPNDILRQSR